MTSIVPRFTNGEPAKQLLHMNPANRAPRERLGHHIAAVKCGRHVEIQANPIGQTTIKDDKTLAIPSTSTPEPIHILEKHNPSKDIKNTCPTMEWRHLYLWPGTKDQHLEVLEEYVEEVSNTTALTGGDSS